MELKTPTKVTFKKIINNAGLYPRNPHFNETSPCDTSTEACMCGTTDTGTVLRQRFAFYCRAFLFLRLTAMIHITSSQKRFLICVFLIQYKETAVTHTAGAQKSKLVAPGLPLIKEWRCNMQVSNQEKYCCIIPIATSMKVTVGGWLTWSGIL